MYYGDRYHFRYRDEYYYYDDEEKAEDGICRHY